MNLCNIKYHMIVMLSTLLVMTYCRQTLAVGVGQDQIALQIESFLSNPHGLNRLSPQDYKAIEEIRRGFDKEHLAILNEAISICEGKAIHDIARVQRRSRALGLLGLIGGDLARSTLIKDYQRITTQVREIDRRESVGQFDTYPSNSIEILLHLRVHTLMQLTELGAVELVDEIMTDIPVADGPTRVVMIDYLEKVAPLRPDIRPKLVEMYQSPTSRLRNHPQLLRVLEAIDRAEADKAVSKNERKAPRNP